MFQSKLHVALLAAVGKRLEIGKDNALLWRIPLDLAFYKNATWGMTLLVGKNTYLSMLNSKGLPPAGRKYVIVSSTLRTEEVARGNIVFPNINLALTYCSEELFCRKIIVVGGQSIYEQTLPFADELILTHVDQLFEQADTFFPSFDEKAWEMVCSKTVEDATLTPYPLFFRSYRPAKSS